MACDIHLHIEVKIDAQWHHLNAPSIDRNYRLFSRMGDVRQCDEIVLEPLSIDRGLPEDATFITKFDCERLGHDGHSHSWLSSREVGTLIKTREKWDRWDRKNSHGSSMSDIFGYLLGNTFDGFVDYPEDRQGIEDFRFIFWFDN